MKVYFSLFVTFFLFISISLKSQDLLALLDSIDNSEEITTYIDGTFKAPRLINGYTSEIAPKKELVFSISHRFGKVNGGFYEFFGLDQSTIRFGFDYGITEKVALGIGRSSYDKLYDGYAKIKVIKQSTGEKSFPVSITILEGITYRTLKWYLDNDLYPTRVRFSYIHELFISRKFNEKLSFQLVPVIVHRNLVKEKADQNTVLAIGFGGRYKITNHFTFVGEYYYLLPGKTADDYFNSTALGFEIETGGHVFQLNFSNSHGMTEKIFIPETNGDIKNGDIHFGFNIIRFF